MMTKLRTGHITSSSHNNNNNNDIDIDNHHSNHSKYDDTVTPHGENDVNVTLLESSLHGGGMVIKPSTTKMIVSSSSSLTSTTPLLHDWENCKENTAPLRHGRKIDSISSKQYRTSNEEQQQQTFILQQYEQQIQQLLQSQQLKLQDSSPINNDNNTDTNEDPLQIWISYIQYLQNHIYIQKSLPTCPELFHIYEQCIQYIIGNNSSSHESSSSSSSSILLHRYQEDVRFIRMVCLYADASYDPLYTFYTLYTQYHIGRMQAMYYNAWAYTAEIYHYFILTQSIFIMGLQQLHSIDTTSTTTTTTSSSSLEASASWQYLQLRYQRFQKRMHRYWRNYLAQQGESEGDDDRMDHNVSMSHPPPQQNHNDNDEDPHYLQELWKYHHQQPQPSNQGITISLPPTTSSMRGILHPLSSTVNRHATTPLDVSLLRPPPHLNSSSSVRRRPSSRPTNTNNTTFTDRSRNPNHHSTSNIPNAPPPSTSFAIFSDTTDPSDPNHHPPQQHGRGLLFPSTHYPIGSDQGSVPVPEQVFPIGTFELSHRSRINPPLIPEVERYKENQNHIPIERWNESGPLRNTYTTSSSSGGGSSNNENHINVNTHPHYPTSIQSNTVVGFAIHVDEECLQQQQEEEALRQQQMKQHRMVRDDRHRPAVIPTTTTKTAAAAAAAKTTSSHKKQITQPMWKHRLLTNPNTQQEQSLEEARFHHGYYHIDTNSINMNQLDRQRLSTNHINDVTAEDDDVENEMSMSMEELLSIHEEHTEQSISSFVAVETQGPLFPIHTPTVTSNLHHENHQQNISTTSSTYNDDNDGMNGCRPRQSHATMVVAVSSEPTINTQFAMRELSFMFASPVVPTAPAANQDHVALEVFQEIDASITPTTTCRNQQKENARSSTTTHFTIYEEKENDSESIHQPISSTGHHGFTIFCEDPITSTTLQPVPTTTNPPTWTIYSDEPTESPLIPNHRSIEPKDGLVEPPPSTQPIASPLTLANGDTAIFTISDLQLPSSSRSSCEWEKNHQYPSGSNTVIGPATSTRSVVSSPDECQSHGDTATFPLLLTKELYSREQENENKVMDEASTSLHEPRDYGRRQSFIHKNYIRSNGDTLTELNLLSMPNAIDVKNNTKSQRATNYSIGIPDSYRSNATVTTTTPESPFAVGNISMIVPNDDTTTIHVPISPISKYMDVYNRSIQDATLRLKASQTLGSFPRRKKLAEVLSTSGSIYDLPTCVLPRPFKQGTVQKGTEFMIDFCKGVVDQVISRGLNEIVMTLQHGDDIIVVKSQSPIGCLAWEYQILRTIEIRLQKELPRSIVSPFPTALSFVFLVDGAILTTSMDWNSGRNLMDLKRLYDAIGEEIPEVLILHYTARMLHYTEILHWHAKVLHCKVRPENWILTSVSSKNDNELIADLRLVNFASAIDLAHIDRTSNETEQRWMDQVLKGDTTVDALRCVSMRLGLPWSFDVDTFGICECVYSLMHRTPFDIQQSKDASGTKWVPILKFPRHFHNELWTEIFDTLLNLDEDFGRAIGSRPYNLKRLRKKIEEHLQSGNNVTLLDAALRYQFSLLSS